MFTVDKGVPLPRPGSWKKQYPFRLMDVGDSFFVAGKVPKAIGGNITNAKRRIQGSDWAMRTVTEGGVLGVRVWRVK